MTAFGNLILHAGRTKLSFSCVKPGVVLSMTVASTSQVMPAPNPWAGGRSLAWCLMSGAALVPPAAWGHQGSEN